LTTDEGKAPVLHRAEEGKRQEGKKSGPTWGRLTGERNDGDRWAVLLGGAGYIGVG